MHVVRQPNADFFWTLQKQSKVPLFTGHSSHNHDNECQSLIQTWLFNSSFLYRMDKHSIRKFLIQQSILGGLIILLGECMFLISLFQISFMRQEVRAAGVLSSAWCRGGETWTQWELQFQALPYTVTRDCGGRSWTEQNSSSYKEKMENMPGMEQIRTKGYRNSAPGVLLLHPFFTGVLFFLNNYVCRKNQNSTS